MYTQRRTTPEGAPIPQNYSGNAFRYPPIGSLGQDTVVEPTPPMTVGPNAGPTVGPNAGPTVGSISDPTDGSTIELPLPADPPMEEIGESYPPVLDGSRPSTVAPTARPSLLGSLGFGHEELLLLGLCLLLSGDGFSLFSRAGRGGDILPYLMLLLICG